MGNGNWFRRGGRRAKSGVKNGGSAKRKGWLSSAANRCALSFESLEDRNMLAVFMVTTTADIVNGNVQFGSLRWALNQANGNVDSDTIVFSENLFSFGGEFVSPATIGLNGGALPITQQVSILGPGPRKLTIAQTEADNRVFNINIGTDVQVRNVEISGVTISGGSISGDGEEDKGGGIYNREALTMVETIIMGNSASMGGGGVYTAFGRLTLDRSLVMNNSGFGDGGGGILNGRPTGNNQPTTTITNSTITNNSAGRWGGGVFNRNGSLNLEHVTITNNNAGEAGDGVASFGNGVGAAPAPPAPPPMPPARTVFTTVYGSIIYGNGGPMGSDIDRVGETEEDPPRELNPSITSRGYNIVGTGNATVTDLTPPDPLPANDPMTDFAFDEPTDQVITNPMVKVFRTDDMGDPLGLQDFGGSTNVYLLDDTSPALDAGDPDFFGQYEQRGRHFTRVFDYTLSGTAVVDIGAVEMQVGDFVVDTLIDEDNLSFSQVFTLEFVAGLPQFSIGGYEAQGNFSLREAIEFAAKNPGLDTIRFSDDLNSPELIEDEDLNASPAPTIILSPTFGSFFVGEDLIIQGPEGFILELDAIGLDTNPNSQNGTGSRVFEINDGLATFSKVTMSNLTIMGGDVVSQGGGIRSWEDLDLVQMTFKNNNATADGGAIWLTAGAIADIDRSTFNNNRAGNNGGAIYAQGFSTVNLTSSTVSSNVAGNRGGGIYSNNSTVLVEYSTITLNNAGSTLASGIGVQGSTSTVDVRSTIISGNTSNDVDFFSGASAAFTSLGYNLIGRGTASAAFSAATGDKTGVNNPMLEALALNGSLVATHAPIYRPDDGLVSPVIDMGDPDAEAGLNDVPDYDQRGAGFIRVYDVLGGGARIDIGAFELQAAVFEVSSLIDENDGVVTPGNMSLREAIALANLNPLFDVITFDANITGMFEPNIFLGGGFLAPGTSADIRITSSMRVEWHGDTQILINGASLDNPSATIFGSRMFTIDDGDLTRQIDVEFSGGNSVIQFWAANSSQGGGVFYSRENLTLRDILLHDNHTFDFDETGLGIPVVDQTDLHGGSLYQDGTGQATKPTMLLERVRITGSSTIDVNADGGAIYVVDAALILDDSTITGNSTTMADSDGGGIALKNSTLLSQGFTTITGNIVQSGAGDGGGVYFSDGSAVTLINTVVSGNNTFGGNSVGGGLAGVNSQLIVDSSIISENFTLGTQSSGGGIALSGGAAIIDASSVRENFVSGNNSHGGGIWNNGGVLTVRGSSVVLNDATHASSQGGGVYSDTNLAGTQSTLIVNSTISGNSATLGGAGVYNADGKTEIKNSTITDNQLTGGGAGGGVATFGNTASTLTSVQNSIIAGNHGLGPASVSDVSFVAGTFSNSFQSLGYNIIGVGNATAKFNQTGDQAEVFNPGLASLADNGRPVGVAFEMLTHALLPDSIAINRGDPAFNDGSLPEDQRGDVRKQKGRIDIGALESDFAPPGTADFDGDSDVDGSDFLTWQRNLGRTSATLAQGDANGDGTVNGADLTAWKDTFGPASAVSVAASSSGTAFASAEVQSAPAENDPSTAANGFSSLASLGAPGSSVPSATMAKVSDAAATFEAAVANTAASALAWESADGGSLLDDESDFDSLLAAEVDANGAAEDAVFADWGVGRLF